MNYLAIDIGGTFIKYAVITENCSILEKDKTPTKQDSLEIFIQSLTEICDRIKGQYEIEGIALSMPGIIDSKRGFMYTGGSLFCISNVNIVEILEKKTTVLETEDGVTYTVIYTLQGEIGVQQELYLH